jgi:hypothetical protein
MMTGAAYLKLERSSAKFWIDDEIVMMLVITKIHFETVH